MREGAFIGDVIAAHGGRPRWARVSHVDVAFSAGGFAFARRHLDPALLRGVIGRFYPRTPAATIDAFGSRHARGEFANRAVRLRARGGEMLINRPQARNRFDAIMRQLRWALAWIEIANIKHGAVESVAPVTAESGACR